MATDRALRDEAILHRIALNRHSTALVRKVLTQLNRVDADLVARIARADNEGRAPFQLERMLDEIRAFQADGWTIIRARLTDDINALAGAEGAFTDRLVRSGSRQVGATVVAGAPSAGQIIAAVNARPFQGRFLGDWLSEVEAGDAKRVREAVRQGFIEGQSVSDIVRRIRGTKALQYRDGIMEISRRSAETMVRTAVTHTSAVAQEETYQAMGEVVAGVIWVSTLDSRTSVVCAGRDGTQYAVGAGPRPPAHPNCRSTTIPFIRGLEPLPRRSYAQWLADQPPATQDDILGATKARLFRSGALSLDRFIDRTGYVLTLEQLKKRNSGAFERMAA